MTLKKNVDEKVLRFVYAAAIIDRLVEIHPVRQSNGNEFRRRMTFNNLELQKFLLDRYAHLLLGILRKDISRNDVVIPHLMDGTCLLFSRSGVRYEVACGVMGKMISHFAEQIATERESESPDLSLISDWESAKGLITSERDDLIPDDSVGIELYINIYGIAVGLLF